LTRPEAPFDAPWQAQLFAMTVAMSEAGHFTWAEWTGLFGPRVTHAGPETYWEIWSEALVEMVERRGIAPRDEVEALTRRWQAAARATPHGRPITLAAASRD
jgi:nitrile hydratase accessory protein